MNALEQAYEDMKELRKKYKESHPNRKSEVSLQIELLRQQINTLESIRGLGA